MRDLAGAAGVNANTARGLYRRLEDEGLAVSRHGSGTFVAPERQGLPLPRGARGRASRPRHSRRASTRASSARALYCGSPGDDPFPSLPPDREALRAQIARLEATLAAFPDAEPVGHASRSAIPGPHIPSIDGAREHPRPAAGRHRGRARRRREGRRARARRSPPARMRSSPRTSRDRGDRARPPARSARSWTGGGRPSPPSAPGRPDGPDGRPTSRSCRRRPSSSRSGT